MSLISEALRKAHLDAMRQEKGEPRMYHTPGSIDTPSVPPSRRPLLAVVLLSNLVLLVAVAAIVWYAVNRFTAGEAQERPGRTAAEAAAAPPSVERPVAPAAAAVAGSPQPRPAGSVDAEPVAPAPEQRVPDTAAAVVPRPARTRPAPEEQPAERKVVGSIESPPEETVRRAAADATERGGRSRDGLLDGQTYVKTVPTPGGNEVTLNGVSVVGGRGVAIVNGRVVGEGDRVGGFVVEGVEPGRVKLRYRDISIYLALP